MWDEPLYLKMQLFLEVEADTSSGRTTMEFVYVAVVVFALLSRGQSAPASSCAALIQPLEIQRDQLQGNWMVVAEKADFQDVEVKMNHFKQSMWWKVSAAQESDAFNFMSSMKAFGFCVGVKLKMTLVNNTLRLVITNQTLHHLLQPDCLLLGRSQDSVIDRMIFLSKRRTLSDAELEGFKKLGECFNLTQTMNVNTGGDVCPEPPPFEEIDNINFFIDGQRSDIENIMERILSSVGGTENFLKMISEEPSTDV
ncbi:Hypothetical protein SMAX5B_007411 [Scophthalmus maximus]|uniref:Apolipoprotein M n=1 Tax=Scophthalmus maximus TaxID=52904 RepID=A0A2U9BPU7_SCOMX|nr:Hypothetical protein SMAX5B_007411 [Scophthalmus maximus]